MKIFFDIFNNLKIKANLKNKMYNFVDRFIYQHLPVKSLKPSQNANKKYSFETCL